MSGVEQRPLPLEISVGAEVTSVGSGEVSVGRAEDNDVVVGRDDNRVSRRHATLRWTGDSWRWVDHSTSGSFVDGQRRDEFVVSGEVQVALGAPDGPVATLSPGGVAVPVRALVVRSGDVDRMVEPGGEVTIGRDAASDVVVDDGSVSRLHLVVGHDGERWVVHDRSSNGTYVGGERIAGQLRLESATRLCLGRPDGAAVELDPGTTAKPPSDRFPKGLGNLPKDRLGGMGGSVPGSLLQSRPVVGTLRIGRASDNDIVIDDDLTVSRHHAELRTLSDGTLLLVDVGSKTGTFLDGRRVERAPVADGALVGVGRHLLVLRDGMLDEYVDDGVHLDVRDLDVRVPGRLLLDKLNFAVEPGQLVAVVGPSGAGKTTLLRSITGMEPQAGATVHYNGRQLRASIDELRFRIGYVPQDDILHTTLRLQDALRYAADLRFADDVSRGERDARVAEVLEELGLSDRADLQIAKLSGGQRKRASVGLELLTRPALLFLDEPTSGLDPGFERSVMELLRGLADAGHTVVVITHAVASLDMCDRVLFLATGGRMAFYGPPAEALGYFGARDYADVFVELGRSDVDWTARLRSDPAWERWVERAPVVPVAAATGPAPPVRARAGWGRQLVTLSRRAVAVLVSTRGHAALLLAQAPAIALLLLVSVGTDNLTGTSGTPRALLAVLVLASAAMGLVNSCREIVREGAIYRRERTVGLSLTAYLASKFVCLGVLAALQAVVLSALVLSAQGGPPDGVLTGSGSVDLTLFVFATAFSTVAAGLAVSALVQTDSAALVMIPVLIVAQLVLSNAFLDVEDTVGLQQAAWTSPGYWGMRGMASSADLLTLEAKEYNGVLVSSCLLDEDPRVPPQEREVVQGILGEAPCPENWVPTTDSALAAVAGLVTVSLAYAAIAAVGLRRRDPL